MILRVTDHALARARRRFKLRGSRFYVWSVIFGVLLKAKRIRHLHNSRFLFKHAFWLLVVEVLPFEIVVVTIINRENEAYLCNNTE
jgi:hypothetical protein